MMRMLSLAWIDDGLRTQLIQHPVHPSELGRRHTEQESLPFPFGFHIKLAPLFGVGVQHQIAHDDVVRIDDADRVLFGAREEDGGDEAVVAGAEDEDIAGAGESRHGACPQR